MYTEYQAKNCVGELHKLVNRFAEILKEHLVSIDINLPMKFAVKSCIKNSKIDMNGNDVSLYEMGSLLLNHTQLVTKHDYQLYRDCASRYFDTILGNFKSVETELMLTNATTEIVKVRLNACYMLVACSVLQKLFSWKLFDNYQDRDIVHDLMSHSI